MRYTKMHGAGNSFLILENLHGELQGEDLRDLALRFCSPFTGPGADGMIVLRPDREADFAMDFYNSDGSTGEMCGNGARCVARYGLEHGLCRDPERIRFRAEAGLIAARRIDEAALLFAGALPGLLRRLDACDLAVLSGDDMLAFPMIAVGARGVISVASTPSLPLP